MLREWKLARFNIRPARLDAVHTLYSRDNGQIRFLGAETAARLYAIVFGDLASTRDDPLRVIFRFISALSRERNIEVERWTFSNRAQRQG
jgi:hypothetical protein